LSCQLVFHRPRIAGPEQIAAETALTAATGRPASDVLASFTWPAIAAGKWVVLDFVFVAVAPVLFARLRQSRVRANVPSHH
jgi:hypothetical protein